ncbi:uncharacterized protein LOC128383396 [Scomber japonicus]|uniref:uncharacterized protein LOC128383396 n=1 Tax=Scomber japonicus TaxID=13676 RepID=UPI002304FE9A|nr:uncharacterized protein LOC128383396 [Scomber japonicus]
MKSFTLITVVFLCSISWVSVSVSESQTVEVQPGKEVTLLCFNISTTPTQTDWFRVVNRTKASCIASMYGSEGEVSLCDGFQNTKFKMSSNISTVFLKITQVDLSDSGLYFCGFYISTHTVIANVTELQVQEESDGRINLMSVILGAVTLLLTIIIIVLAVKSMKCQTAANEEPQPGRNKAKSFYQRKTSASTTNIKRLPAFKDQQ